jgi:protocatechuate 3,4-dioxygenase beta subunit
MKSICLASVISCCALLAQSSSDAPSVEGHVYNSLSGAAVGKARVELSDNSGDIRLNAETDAAGLYQFFGLPAGSYRLAASRTGFLKRGAPRVARVEPNQPAARADFRLMPGAVIGGHVFGEDGEPLEGALVRVEKQVSHRGRKHWLDINASGESNERGEYRITGLEPGRYIVRSWYPRAEVNNRYGAAPNRHYQTTYSPNTMSEEQASPVTAAGGDELSSIDIQLVREARPRSVTLSGRVVNVPTSPAGGPVEISIWLRPTDGARSSGGQGMARPPDYAFSVKSVPGQFELRAFVYSGEPESYGSRQIALAEDTSGVVISMNPPIQVSGRLVLADEGPQVNLLGIRVELTTNPKLGRFSVRSDSAGRFAFPKPATPGHYTIWSIDSLPKELFVQEVKFGGQEIPGDEFDVTAATRAQLEIVLGRNAGKITGAVLNAEGKAASGSTITLIPDSSKAWPLKCRADDDGNFSFHSLRPGKYRIFAWEEIDNDLWQDPDFLRTYEPHSTLVTVGAGENPAVQARLISAAALM